MKSTLSQDHYLKQVHMSDSKLKQLQYEADTWKRSLAFIKEENIWFKNRLSEILSDQFDKYLLGEADDFQSRFIKEDDLVGLLEKNVEEMDKLLVREIFEDGRIMKEIDKKLKKLRANIAVAEDQFKRLKSDFNHFLSENIL
jgi:hypothetical protein